MPRILLSVVLTTAAASAATFHKDVLPILQRQCQECHRPGEVAPMSFLTYKDTRPWAKSIKAAVLKGKMPPWFVEPGHRALTNEHRLTPAEVKTLVAWVDGGATEGSPKDAPPPRTWATGWQIGKPDIIVEFPHDIAIPPTGVLDQSNLLVKVNFPQDIWVKAAEVRPGNPKVVHHMKAWIRPPGSPWMANAPEGELYPATAAQFVVLPVGAPGLRPEPLAPTPDRPRPVQDILAKYNPGVNAEEFTLGGAAKFIAAGSDIVFECHYTTNGKPETDRSRVGIVLAPAPPKMRYITTAGLNNLRFVIPAGAPNHEVRAEAIIENEVQLAWVQPHMHLRAKDYELRAYYPTGESEILLKGKFDFNWQLGYEFARPVVLPRGTRLESIAHFDNSANNTYNPNPDIDIRYGPQTTDEMAVSFMGFLMDANLDPARVLPHRIPFAVVE
jgi:hypothetical protein